MLVARSAERIRHHYVIERELADRLRAAPAESRLSLYTAVYDELFRRVPDHPQLTARDDPQERVQRLRSVGWQMAFLKHALTPQTVFMEVGAGDCALALRAARQVASVYAVDVSPEIARVPVSPNVKLVLCDGVSIPVPAASVDVAFSNQLMEHLHPDDAAAQLRSIHRSLKAGGRYLCITPNRLYGPRDVSSHFDPVATGLHLKEYSARELHALLRRAGFREVRFYCGARGWYVRIPYLALAAAEAVLDALPWKLRRRLADTAPARAALGLYAEAVK
jgi:SAM-dependent methyltransferase